MVERSPEKAGVGGSIPSLATIPSMSYEPPKSKGWLQLVQIPPPMAAPSEPCLTTGVVCGLSGFSLRRRAQRWPLRGWGSSIARLRCHSLKLSQVYGAIAYYLENEETIKQYIADGDRELERSVPPLSQTNPDLFARLETARRQTSPKRS